MKNKSDLARLRDITDMVLEAKLAQLRAANLKRQRTLAQIDGLQNVNAGSQAQGIADAMAAMSYQRWANMRRAELSQVLARQSAECLDARDAAYLAFGRSRGLDLVRQRLEKIKPRQT